MKVYLAGNKTDGMWRDDLVDPEVTVLSSRESKRSDAGALWPTRKKSVLGRHHYVGPYFDPGLRASVDAHLRAASLLTSNMVFFYMNGTVPSAIALFEIGFALGNEIPVVLGFNNMNVFKKLPFLSHAVDLKVHSSSPTNALREAAIEVTPAGPVNQGKSWVLMPSKWDNTCKFCNEMIEQGNQIAWRKRDGASEVAHPKCFVAGALRRTAEATLKDEAWDLLQQENRRLQEELEHLRSNHGRSEQHRME